MRERRDDDDEALEPHPDVHEQHDDEQRRRAAADLLGPQQQRDEHVAGEHGPLAHQKWPVKRHQNISRSNLLGPYQAQKNSHRYE